MSLKSEITISPTVEIDPALAATSIRIYDVMGHRSIHLDPPTATATSCRMKSTSLPVSVPASGVSDPVIPAPPVPPVSEESSEPSAEHELVQDASSSGAATEPGTQPWTQPATQRIAGLVATLTRTTREVSTGQIPNAQQIQVVDELWTSPLYQMPLMHVIDDPRYGRIVLRVVHFEAREPSASLFNVPYGYTVQTQENGTCGAAPSGAAKR